MTCYDPCQAQCGNMWKTLKPWPWHGNIRNRNDTTAESPSAVTLLCCRVLLVLLVHLVFLRLLGILRVLCVLLGVLRATQSRSDILTFLCTARLHSLVVYVIVSYCLILFHIVSFCFQVKLQIGRNNQNQNISKQSLWQRRLQKRCPGSSLVSSTGGGSSQSGLWESWSVWKKNQHNHCCICKHIYNVYIDIYLYLYLYLYKHSVWNVQVGMYRCGIIRSSPCSFDQASCTI